jgi:hypothetical protein
LLGLRYFIVFEEIKTESRNSAGCVFLLFWLKNRVVTNSNKREKYSFIF